jgi:MoxR-like ATPase
MSAKVKSQVGKLQLLRAALEERFLERGSLVEGMLVALLARETLFMLGPPGSGKSAIVRVICSAIQGKYFEYCFTKFTTPEEIFGPLSLKGLSNDSYKRITAGKLPEADVYFGDEIFKCSSAIGNTLLPIFNERSFSNGNPTPDKIPLKVAYCASNELPTGQELAALWDRMVLRFDVRYLQNDSSVASMLSNAANSGKKYNNDVPSITPAELQAEFDAVDKVTIPQDVIDEIVKMRRSIAAEGIDVSDRKWVQTLRILKAQAHLNGRTEVDCEDFEMLENVLWSQPEQFKKVRKVVGKHGNPIGEQIVNIVDGALGVVAAFKADPVKTTDIEAHTKLKDAKAKLEKLKQANPNNAKLDRALDQVKTIHAEIVKNLM